MVFNKIDSAFSNATFDGRYWEGVSDNGIKIGGYVDENDRKSTAFPLICSS